MNIKKFITRLILSGAAGLIILCSCVFFISDIIDLNKYKDSVFQTVKKETGYEIKCEDVSIKHSFSPYINIRFFHTVVLYPNGEVFLKLKESDVSVKILPLLFKKLVIKDIKSERPIINIFLYKDYSDSLEKYSLKNKKLNSGDFILTQISSGIFCKNYKINLHDLSINRKFYAEGDKLIVKEQNDFKTFKIVTKGSFYHEKKKYINYDLDFIADIESDAPKFTFSPFKTIFEDNVKADIYSRLKTGRNNELFGELKISNLSFKVDDIAMKNNNLDFVFNGNNFKTNAVMHPSDKEIIKLNGSVSFGEKKKADINVFADNTQMQNLMILISEITDILNINNPAKDYLFTGLMSADFNVKSDLKKLKSSGRIKISNGAVKHKTLPYSVTDINANINLNDNNIKTEGATAKINSVLMTFKGEMNENAEFKISACSSGLDVNAASKLLLSSVNIPLDINKGTLSFNADLSGSLNKNIDGKIKINTSGLSFTEKTTKIPVNTQKANFDLLISGGKYKGEMNISGILSKIENREVKAETFKAMFDEKNLVIPQNKIIQPAVFTYEGVINDYMSNPSGNINFNGKISSHVLSGILKNTVKLPNKPEGFIQTSGNVGFKNKTVSVKTKLNADKNNYISYLVIKELLNKPSILDTDCVFENDKIMINNVSLSEAGGNKIINITGEIANLKNPSFKNLRIKIPSVMTFNTGFSGGETTSINGETVLNNNINSPEVKGNIKIIKQYISGLSADIRNADLILNGHYVKIIAPYITVKNSPFSVTADIKHDSKLITAENITINGKTLDLNLFFDSMYGFSEKNEFPQISVKKGRINLEGAIISGLKADNITGDFTFSNNIIEIPFLRANAYGGRISGEIKYNTYSKLLKIKANSRNTDIKTALYDLCGFEDNLAGKADIDGDISMYTGKGNIALKTLSGKAEINSHNGKAGTLGKFEYYLSARNIIHKGIMNTTLNKIISAVSKDDTSNYNRAYGTVSFKNGLIYTDGIKTEGNKMSLYILGSHNMLTANSSLNIYGRISNEIKSKLGNLGNVSPSELFNSQAGTKQGYVMSVPYYLIKEIPPLYNKPSDGSDLFKVNISGYIKSVNSIKNFNWIQAGNIRTTTQIPEENNEPSAQKTPEFSDM